LAAARVAAAGYSIRRRPPTATPAPSRCDGSPLTGCHADIVAAARAKALLNGLGPPQGQDVYWRAEGEKVLTCYLLAAASGHHTMNDVVAWSAAEASPVTINALSNVGLHNGARMLEGLSTRNDRYRAGVWGQVTQALFPLNMATLARFGDLRAGEGVDRPLRHQRRHGLRPR
jgi:hypothetical protein